MNKKRILNVYHPKITAWLWLLGMLLIGVLSNQVLRTHWLETGFLALLPASEQQPDIAKAIQQHNALMSGKVVWLTGAANSQAAIAQAQQLKTRLQQSGLFNRVVLEQSSQTYIDNYQQLFPFRYQLLDSQTQRVLHENPKALIDENLAMLYSPIGQLQAASLAQDPLLLFSRYFNAQQPIKFNLEQGVVVLQEQATVWALLVSDLKDNNLPLDELETLLALVKQAQAADGELMVSGMPLFTASGAQSAQQEMSTVGLGSSVAIVLLMLMTFRSLRPLTLSFLAITSGMFAALVLSVWFFGKLHIITLVFGASLIGVADDYALHFFCDSFESKDWNSRRGLAFILPGLFIGLLTNLLSYAGLGFSPFPGLQEVALFSAIGLLGAWLTVVLLFPVLLTGFQPEHEPKLLRLTNYWQQHWALWVFKHSYLLTLLMVIVIAGGLWKLTPRDDVRLLQSAPAELLKTADHIKQVLPISQENQFFLVSGENIDAWYHNEQQLLAQLDNLKQQHALTLYQGISQYWANEASQQANYQLLKKTLYDSDLVTQYMTELGFSEQAIKTEVQEFADAKQQIIPLLAWLKTADESKQQLWLGCESGQCLSIISLTGINNLSALSALPPLAGVSLIDPAGDLSALFARYRIRATGLLISAYCLVFLGLIVKFAWRNACKIIAVPVVAALVSLAMMGWFDQLFSLFNLFALLLVLGIGIDDAIFFYLANNSTDGKDKRDTTSLAVVLSALTTLLAFGLLAISSTEIVHAFGFTVAVGILTALLGAPLLGLTHKR
jgi:predicted exporter